MGNQERIPINVGLKQLLRRRQPGTWSGLDRGPADRSSEGCVNGYQVLIGKNHSTRETQSKHSNEQETQAPETTAIGVRF